MQTTIRVIGEDRQIGRFLLRNEHFQQVREHMQTVLTIEVTDAIVESFLAEHEALLGMIVQYDEVETEARYEIWDACRSSFDASQKRRL